MNLCWKSGKCSYDEKRRAYRHLVSLRVDYGYGGEVYRCPHCGGWHVGRRPGTTAGRRDEPPRLGEMLAEAWEEYTGDGR